MNLITKETLDDVDYAIVGSRSVTPNDQLLPLFNAAAGKLNEMMLRHFMFSVRRQAIEVAALAIRIATEGDTTYNSLRELSGIDVVNNSKSWINKLVIPMQEGGFPIGVKIPYAWDNYKYRGFNSWESFTEYVADAILLGAIIDDKSCNDHITKAIRNAQQLVENETKTGDK